MSVAIGVVAQTCAAPTGTRVGTVDKFQGAEAAVVLVSMATSSGDCLPRDIELLYSKNRVNAALSNTRGLPIEQLALRRHQVRAPVEATPNLSGPRRERQKKGRAEAGLSFARRRASIRVCVEPAQ